jgi:recombination DNA repair RAD52 pathway protein
MEYTEVAKALSSKLHPDTVKTRRQGGAQVSYIEGWWAMQNH